MQTDLFTTKKQQVREFIMRRGWCPTHAVIAFGLSIGLNRSDRDAREIAEEDKLSNKQHDIIRRMPEELKKLRFPSSKEDYWEYIR